MKKLLILAILLSFRSVFPQWTQTLNGISIWSLAKDNSGNVYAGSLGSSSALYRTTNAGINWVSLTGGNGQTVFSIAIDSAGNIFAANYSAGMLRSTNGGSSFVTMPVSNFGNSNPQVIACGKNGHVYVGTNGGGFYRSTDTGTTFTFTGLSSLQVISLLVDKYNSAIVYAGVTSTTAGPNGFYRSTDYGASFSANLNPNKNIYGILQKSTNDLYTVSTTTGGPFDKSTNGGLNWTTVTTGYIARGIADGDLSSHIYIAGNGGVFYSTNGGVSFSNDALTFSTTPIIKSINNMYVGASGSSNGGVWIRSFPLAVGNNNEAVSDFKLEQNYPNPFNPTTKIRFQIPLLRGVSEGRGMLSSMKIYNSLGLEITSLFSQQLSPGTYEIEWNASDSPSGVYFYKLEVNDPSTGSGRGFSETKRMVLIK